MCSNTPRINTCYHVLHHSKAAELRELWNELLKIQLEHLLRLNSLQVWDSILRFCTLYIASKLVANMSSHQARNQYTAGVLVESKGNMGWDG